MFLKTKNTITRKAIYDIVSKDALNARIEGTNKGKEMSSDFTYSRVK